MGGTRFVVRALGQETLGRDHEITTFNRGQTGVDLPGVEAVRGDRVSATDLQKLFAKRSWDVVMDSSGYVPRVVGRAPWSDAPSGTSSSPPSRSIWPGRRLDLPALGGDGP
jgi:nucleoside-diphosphate-sugar epimerase